MRCPVCRRPVQFESGPFCSASCRYAFREARRQSYAEPAGPLPPELADALHATLHEQGTEVPAIRPA
ncbi:MAG TPA: hypothetical protein VKV26_04770 [Dehalococcoidia bacterium]|nr:hypothetical protein [Dehalococcoidia bacterium]